MDRALWVTTQSPDETRILGAALGPLLLPGDVVSLGGELGAGKTTLVQGIAAALGVQRQVTSPTFTIVHEYEGRYPIMHLDVYRLNSIQEVLDLGFDELLDPGAILLLEWGEAVGPLLPKRYLEIDIRRSADGRPENERPFMFRPHGVEWIPKLQAMRDTAETLLAATVEAADSPRFFDSPPQEMG
ncbi:MAG: tRNA (adenosine(37)-N6)-threonylcarbamoyltransferase complex ATPase subunit type 1 TsaE [Actinomycetota bacterium]